MNNFNNILEVVQKHCNKHGTISGITRLRGVAAEIGIPIERLIFYLDCFQRIGLVNFNQEEEIVSLTDKGKNESSLFL